MSQPNCTLDGRVATPRAPQNTCATAPQAARSKKQTNGSRISQNGPEMGKLWQETDFRFFSCCGPQRSVTDSTLDARAAAQHVTRNSQLRTQDAAGSKGESSKPRISQNDQGTKKIWSKTAGACCWCCALRATNNTTAGRGATQQVTENSQSFQHDAAPSKELNNGPRIS